MHTGDDDNREDTERLDLAHRRLLDEIAAETKATASWTGREVLSPAVMAAMAKVPRHRFVPLWERTFAYDNRPLGIGHGQTISQPYIVAIMSDLLDVGPGDRVLEVGTGCGYQAAVLAEITGKVYSIEVVPDLARAAAARLARLGYGNVTVRQGDGYAGWPEEAPFDAIIVTAAPAELPEDLIDQLVDGGRLVIPIGVRNETQMLYRGVRDADGTLRLVPKLPVAFVPMVHSG
jgi:protein-L-isoaspartate(D-aspartate) O-methyltransferase